MTQDQTPVDETVVIPMVITLDGGWIVLLEDDNGQPGEAQVGLAYVPPGLTRDLPVVLDEAPATAVLHAILYSDNGLSEEFEPGLTDFPLQFNRLLIGAQFTLLP